jgi:hypothetical protein
MLLIGQPSLNGPFSIAMFVYQRVSGRENVGGLPFCEFNIVLFPLINLTYNENQSRLSK